VQFLNICDARRIWVGQKINKAGKDQALKYSNQQQRKTHKNSIV
jgi:hypothetical protein